MVAIAVLIAAVLIIVNDVYARDASQSDVLASLKSINAVVKSNAITIAISTRITIPRPQ